MDTVVLMAARASRTENQDAIDTAIVGMLADPKEVSLTCTCFVASFHIICNYSESNVFIYFFSLKGSCWYSRSTLPSI